MNSVVNKKRMIIAVFGLMTMLLGQNSHAATARHLTQSQAQGTNPAQVNSHQKNYQLASLSPFMAQTSPATSKALAKKFVKTSELYKGLSLLLLDSAKGSDIVQKAIEQKGFQAVQAAVVLSIREVTKTYRPEWDNFLADLYSRQYSPEMLSSVLKWREESPYFQRFISKQAHLYKDGTLNKTSLFHQAYGDLEIKLKKRFN